MEKTSGRLSKSMADEIPFHLASEMDSAIEVVRDCLDQMRHCCEQEIPFHLASEMDSAIYVSEDCLKKMRHCCEIGEKLARLESYKRNGSLTKIMLLLFPEYESEDDFKRTMKSSITAFGKRLEDLKEYVEGVEEALSAGSYECSECQGTGEIRKFRAIRERGTQPQSVVQVNPCNNCSGSGKLPIGNGLQETLALFLVKANKILLTMVGLRKSLNDFISTCHTRMQVKEMEESKKGELHHSFGRAEPEEKEEPKTTAHAITASAPERARAFRASQEEVAREISPKPKMLPWPYPKEFFLNLLNLKRETSYYSRASDGTPTWWERRANRQYTCSACRNLIEKGERYIGRKKLRLGMLGPYGFKGTYVTDYYHIVCLLKDAQAEIEEKIKDAHSEIGRLENEIAYFGNQKRSKRQKIKNCETQRQKVRKDYQNAVFWRKLDKWVNYRYISWSKSREVSRLEKEIAHIEYGEIPGRETGITGLKERINKLESWLNEILKRMQELTRFIAHTQPRQVPNGTRK